MSGFNTDYTDGSSKNAPQAKPRRAFHIILSLLAGLFFLFLLLLKLFTGPTDKYDLLSGGLMVMAPVAIVFFALAAGVLAGVLIKKPAFGKEYIGPVEKIRIKLNNN